MIKAAIVGTGYWGPNLLRNLFEHRDVEVRWICDLNTAAISKLVRRYPGVQTTTRFEDVITDASLDVVVIATPVHTHAELAARALNAGKDVLITKPMTTTVAEAQRLIDLAEKKQRLLMVDHTFVYHPAVRYMREAVERKDLGNLLYFQSTRMNLGLYQPDVSVIYDLMAHDLSILNELIKEDPIEASVSAKNAARLPQADIAYLQLNYESQFIASIHASWLSPSKIRETILTGSKRMLIYDDNNVVEKVRVFDRGVERGDFLKPDSDPDAAYTKFIQYRQGDVLSPALPSTEALKLEIEHLVDCVKNRTEPRTNGREGLRVVRLLQFADEIARSGKSWVPIPR